MPSIPLPPQQWLSRGVSLLDFPRPGMEHLGCIPIASYLRALLDQELDWQQLVEVAAKLAGSWSSSRLQAEGRISNVYKKIK